MEVIIYGCRVYIADASQRAACCLSFRPWPIPGPQVSPEAGNTVEVHPEDVWHVQTPPGCVLVQEESGEQHLRWPFGDGHQDLTAQNVLSLATLELQGFMVV
jgi:hypothetical protein